MAYPVPSRRAWRWPVRFLLVLGSLLVGLYASEKTLSALDLFGVNHGRETTVYRELLDFVTRPDGEIDLEGMVFRHRPQGYKEFGRFEVRINGLGFRGPEIAPAKPPGTRRILLLGDSVVFGWGVDDEQTFARGLERALNGAEDATGDAVEDVRHEVINAGHLLYDTTQEMALLRDIGIHLAPDIVILVFVINDIEPTRDLVEAILSMDPQDLPEPSLLERLRLEWQTRFPALQELLRLFTDRLAAPSLPTPAAAPGAQEEEAGENPVLERYRRGWKSSQESLKQIRDLCRERGIPLIVLDHCVPSLAGIPALGADLEAYCREIAVPYHDFRFTPEERARPIVNSLCDPHANALGNLFLLQKLQKILAQQ